MIRISICVAILCAMLSPAEARQRQQPTVFAKGCNVLWPCEKPYASSVREQRETRGKYVARQMGFGTPRVIKHSAYKARSVNETAYKSPAPAAATVVAHPDGCPRSAFCGCGAAVRVFGHAVRDLWLASNWFKFPRTSPALGMVAVRRHHVFVLEQHLNGDTWLAYDANSGGHATRIHSRSIAGYVIVNPRA